MDPSQTKPLQERTDAKLRYADVHLQELREYGTSDGSDFDKAHLESFLFHLFGACDAFLAELNHYHDLKLGEENLSPGKIRKALKDQGRKSDALRVLAELEKDSNSWFSRAKAMRDHSAHVKGVPRAYYLGGKNEGRVILRHPRTDALGPDHFHEEFSEWLTTMQELLHDLRASTLAAPNGSTET